MKPQPAGRFGPYLLLRELGRGGMGVVWEALHEPLGRRVALKLIRLEGADAVEEAERVAREARALGRVEHPGVVQVHDTGVLERTAWVAMRLVSGGSLRDRLRRLGPYAPAEAARLGAALADALAAAHRAGVVHRDIKPHNVLLEADGRPVLSDFGLARLADARSLTASGALLGTPAYMAPEQVQGQRADARSDLYSLGATLYEALAGAPPFTGPSAMAVLEQALRQPPAPLRGRVPGVSPGLEALVLQCLEKDPARRPAGAEAVAEALRREGQGPASTARRGRGPALVALLLGLLLVANLGVALSRSGGASSAATRDLEAAQAALRRLDVEGALAVLSSATASGAPEDQALLLARGRACMFLPDLEAARLALHLASCGPDRAVAYDACLELSVVEEQPQRALVHLERAMALEPGRGEAYALALEIFTVVEGPYPVTADERRLAPRAGWQARLEEAAADPSPRVQHMRAGIRLGRLPRDGDPRTRALQEILAILDPLIERDPHDTTARELRGRAKALMPYPQGSFDAAREDFTAATDNQGTSLSDLLLRRAGALLDELAGRAPDPDPQASARAFEPARLMVNLARRRSPLGAGGALAFSRWFELKNGRPGATLEWASRALDVNPCLREAQARVLNCYLQGIEPDEAALAAGRCLTGLTQIDGSPLARCVDSTLRIAQGDSPPAMREFLALAVREVAEQDPVHAPLALRVLQRVEESAQRR